MKKSKILLLCFICLVFMAWLYLDIFVELQSIYWLCGKLILLLLVAIGSTFGRLNKEEGKYSIIASVCFWFMWFGYLGYKDIIKYKRNLCQDKYGMEFNKKRRSLGIPEIPADWHIENRYGSAEWKAKKSVIGHEIKRVYIDSCGIDFETDDYRLKPIDTMERGITVTSQYARGHAKDSVSFYFDVGNDGRAISRKQADSIFAAEKIKKDY